MRVLGFPVHVRPGFLLLHGADRRPLPATSSGSGWPARSPGSRCSTSSATPSPPGGPARRPRSRSTSSPATPRTRAAAPLSRRTEAGDRARRAGDPHHRRRWSSCWRWASTRSTPVEPGELAGVGRRVVGRAGDRRLQPDPGAAARRRQRRDVGARPAAARRGPPVMVYASVAVTAARPCWSSPSSPSGAGSSCSSGLLLIMQLQMLFDERERPRRVDRSTTRGRGDAARRRRRRRRGSSSRGCSRPSATRWSRRSDLADDELRRLRRRCSPPAARRRPVERVRAHQPARARPATTARRRRYGARVYARNPQPMLAATIARAAGALGDEATAVAWLRAAVDRHASPPAWPTVIDQAPELAAVRHRPDVVDLRGRSHRPRWP